MAWGDIAAIVACVASALTGLRVFFTLDKQIAVLEAKHNGISDAIRQGFEGIRREFDSLKEDLRDRRG
jgi:hypothetical protein